MSFLDPGYELPKKEFANNYLNKFEEGETRLRILTKPKLGYEWWIDGNGAIRYGQIQKGDKPIRVGMGEKRPADAEVSKHFWAMPVYNYNEKAVQVAKITSYTIQSAIKNFASDEDWGSPLEYDIVVKRVGKGFNDTEYSVIPKPAKPVAPEIKEAFEKMHIDMEAWMASQDPFKDSEKVEETTSEVVSEDEDISDQVPF